MSKKALTITLFLVIVFSSLFGVIGKEAITEILPAPSPNSDAEIVSSTGTGFRKIHERNYIEGCTKAGSSKEYCDCSFSQFKEAYTPEELAQLAEEFKSTGKLDERMVRVRQVCGNVR